VADDALTAALMRGTIELTGRLVRASNAAFLGTAQLDGTTVRCIYKPVRGERPLWDFPTGTLAGREVAAYTVSELSEWELVPPTVVGNGPFGPGMVQQWIETADELPVDLVPEGQVPEGWLHVLDATDQHDDPVSLIHLADEQMRRFAIFDAVINNADRKASHFLPDASGHVWGCDHGVCFNVEPKLRTVLWGWADEPLHDDELEALVALRARLEGQPGRDALADCISMAEYLQLLERIDDLIRLGRLPDPGDHWPSIPWPVFS